MSEAIKYCSCLPQQKTLDFAGHAPMCAYVRIAKLEAELAFCQRIIKQGSDDLTGEQVAYIFDLPENQHE